MSREEIVNNIGYQLTRAAVDYIEKHEFADGMDCFEAGAEWMQKKMINKACKWIDNNKHLHKELSFGSLSINWNKFIREFRKAMEE